MTKAKDMQNTRTLLGEMPNSTPAPAGLAAMFAVAFINGMNARDLVVHDSAPQAQK